MRIATDLVLAAALAVALLVISPGVAMAAIVALLVVLLCAVSFGVDAVVVRHRARRRDP